MTFLCSTSKLVIQLLVYMMFSQPQIYSKSICIIMHIVSYDVDLKTWCYGLPSVPVRGRFNEACGILKKISCDIKNSAQWFWCQTISMHVSFLLRPYQFSLLITSSYIYTFNHGNILSSVLVKPDMSPKQ